MVEAVFWITVGGWMVIVLLWLWAIERRLAELVELARAAAVRSEGPRGQRQEQLSYGAALLRTTTPPS